MTALIEEQELVACFFDIVWFIGKNLQMKNVYLYFNDIPNYIISIERNCLSNNFSF